MKAVETENIMELTTILLKEIVHTFELIFSPSIATSNTSPDISYIMSTGSMNTHVIGTYTYLVPSYIVIKRIVKC